MRGLCRPYRACWWRRVIPGRRHTFSVPCPGFLFLNIVKKLRIWPFNRLELTFLTRGNEADQGTDIVYAKTRIHPRNTCRCSTPASGGHKTASLVTWISAHLSPAGGGGPAQAGPGVDSGPESLVAAMPRRAILDRPYRGSGPYQTLEFGVNGGPNLTGRWDFRLTGLRTGSAGTADFWGLTRLR